MINWQTSMNLKEVYSTLTSPLWGGGGVGEVDKYIEYVNK